MGLFCCWCLLAFGCWSCFGWGCLLGYWGLYRRFRSYFGGCYFCLGFCCLGVVVFFHFGFIIVYNWGTSASDTSLF